MSGMNTIGREELRSALSAKGGDLRAVGEQFGLTTQQVLMILAYDVSVTSLSTKQDTAQSVLDSLGAAFPVGERPSRT